MYAIEVLKKEHQNILYFIEETRKTCVDILSGKPVDTGLFYEYLSFGRNYADKHHHKKEENILFKVMLEDLGSIAEKLIRHGMLVEHDLGRRYLMDLEEALKEYEETNAVEAKLEIISAMTSYGIFLRRHIEKEDDTVYPFAKRALEDDKKEWVNEETKRFEQEETEKVNERFKAWIIEK